MQKVVKKNADLLGKIATSMAIEWEPEVSRLPKDDTVAVLGLLADRLDIPMSAALDAEMTEDQFRQMASGGKADG